jgi:hypothetical protein
VIVAQPPATFNQKAENADPKRAQLVAAIETLVKAGGGRSAVFSAMLKEYGDRWAAEELLALVAERCPAPQPARAAAGRKAGPGAPAPLCDTAAPLCDTAPAPLCDISPDVTQDSQDSQTLKTHKDSQDTQRADRGSAGGEEERQERTEEGDREGQAGPPVHLPLGEYVLWALDNAESDRECDQLWQQPFLFARLVKAHPAVAKLPAARALAEVVRSLRALARKFKADPYRHLAYFYPDAQEKPGHCRLDGLLEDEDEPVEFLASWDKIRYLPGESPLDQAAERARREPLGLREDVERSKGYRSFVSLAGGLQVTAGDRNIQLPCREVGKLLGVEPKSVSRYRHWAVQDGYLREVKPHVYRGPGKRGEATEFRFDVSQFKGLAEAAQWETAEGFQKA